MLYVTWITVGDLPRGPFQEIANKLKKPLQGYVRLTHQVVSELKSEHLGSTKGPVVLLDADGKQMNSEEFAVQCGQWESNGEHVTFCLGGPKGVEAHLKKQFDVLLSLSRMTTTHDLAHIFYLEQLYRAMTICHHRPYHY